MREKSKIEIFWKNPPDGTATLKRVIGGKIYERRIDQATPLSPVEAKVVLGVTLVRVHQLIKAGQLKTIRKGGNRFIRLKELLQYAREKRPPGRPKSEAFLIN